MEWLYSLFFGGGIAHAVLTFALVITLGILLGKVKIGGVSLGITWILFVGIIFSHFGMTVDGEVRNFVQEFGLILFVFSIGLQVGPGFFASFKHGGMTLVSCAVAIVLLGVLTAYILHLTTGTPIPTMVGILSGAVTNTPGLGAAQQAYADATGGSDPSIALGYAVAYPLGVVGIIFTMIFIRYAFRVKFEKEDEALAELSHEQKFADKVSVEFTNTMLDGRSVEYVRDLVNRQFVISRIMHPDGEISMADNESRIHVGDRLWVICQSEDTEAIVAFFGHRVELSDEDWGNNTPNAELISRRILITKPSINGKKFSDLRLRTKYGITITRVNRAGMDLIPYQGLELQVGDRVMVVGPAIFAFRGPALALGRSRTLRTRRRNEHEQGAGEALEAASGFEAPHGDLPLLCARRLRACRLGDARSLREDRPWPQRRRNGRAPPLPRPRRSAHHAALGRNRLEVRLPARSEVVRADHDELLRDAARFA